MTGTRNIRNGVRLSYMEQESVSCSAFCFERFILVAHEATDYYMITGTLFAEGGAGVKDKMKTTYKPGMFHLYMITDALDFWDGFPELMWGLGFEMDCCHSFEEYRKSTKLNLKQSHSMRDEYRNILYLLEQADRQIVGNYLFSEWRYFTHWSYGWDHYDVDFLRRIIRILESKYTEESNNAAKEGPQT